jgi:type I restriction enzyme S subunit
VKAGWDLRPLESCLDTFRVQSKIPKKKFQKQGRFPVVSQEAGFINGYWDAEDAVCSVKKPIVIFGDHTQVTKYIDFDFVVGADGVKILNPKSFLEAKFLKYFIEANPFPSLGYARHYRHIKSLPIPLPPLAEQKRIVSILDEAFEGLDRARENAEANLKSARELLFSILNEAFRPQRNLSNEPSEELNLQYLGDLCRIVGGGTPSKKNESFWIGDIPWVSPKDMKFNIITDSIDHISAEAAEKSATNLVPAGAILLVVRSGILARKIPIATAGRELSINQDLKAIIPNSNIISSFIAYFLRASEIDLLAKVSLGATVHKLDTPVIKGLRVPVPSIDDQKNLVTRLDAVSDTYDSLAADYRTKLQDISDLRQSLLQKAFAGELT